MPTSIEVDYMASSEIDQISISPNPAKDHVTLSYDLLEQRDITITVYNLQGSKVYTIFNGTQIKGNQILKWTFDNSINDGIYLLKISDGFDSATKKVILQR